MHLTKRVFIFFIFLFSIISISCESTSEFENSYNTNNNRSSSSSRYKTDIDKYYKVLVESDKISDECKLGENEEPEIFYSDDIDTDLYTLRSWYYYPIGYAGLNGPASTVNNLESNAKKLCKRYGAKVALYTYEYTDTRSGWTQYGSYNIKRYDCSIYLFVPYEKSYIQKPKIGIEYRDLDSSDRLKAKRNTGAYITVVYEKSAAFYANLARGDIIIEINGIEILDSDTVFLATFMLEKDNQVVIKYLRNDKENTIAFKIF